METRNHSALRRILTAVTVTVLLALSLGLLSILLFGGAPAARQLPAASLDTIGQFYRNTGNAISDAVSAAASTEKVYRISSSSAVAPKPDRDRFGKAETPAQLADVIADSQKLLDGQELYFSSVTEFIDSFGIEYYQDDTILAITWKQPINNVSYTFSEVKVADASQFRRYLAGGEYGSGKLVYPTEMASTVHAVVASSGDYFAYRSNGIIVYNGNVCRVGTGIDTCYIDVNGDMLFTRRSQNMDAEAAKRYVEENQIQFSLAFGPILVENGQPQEFGGYPLGEIGDPSSRAALCQMGPLHYLLVTANAEEGNMGRATMYEFAREVAKTGCTMAYALDGGQTTALVMNNVLVNEMINGFQRKINDIIYFATAIPN